MGRQYKCKACGEVHDPPTGKRCAKARQLEFGEEDGEVPAMATADETEERDSFSWENARNFYERVGLDVEKGVLQWTDDEEIRELRMQYARTVFPAKRENKEGPRPAPPSAPAGMKCCAPYQHKGCENARDHAPYTHACAYCHRTKTLMCRHPEDDCFRKANDAAKNVKPREKSYSLEK